MTRKATGPDGISAQNLLTMPNEGWERFTAMIGRFENLSQFPAAVTHWKVVFIPKGGSNDKLTVDKLRPLSVGSMVYRIWARCRVKQLSPFLEQHLAPLQANRKMDPEVLHLILRGECPPELYPYGLALDYMKAFDSLNCSLGLHLLQKVGLPKQILGLLASQWQRQTRWLSLGGAIHAEPLQNVPSLPQGDPWSPITLALVLSCPARRCARIFPAVRCTLYLDDRTMVSRDVDALKDAFHDWEQLATVTRLCTNHAKTQFWVRTARVAARFSEDEAPFPIKQHVEVLGFHLGARPHEHPKSIARSAKGKQMAFKIFGLPVPQSFKSQLAHTLLTSNAVWGQEVTNKGPFGEAHDQHLRNFKIAVFGPHSGSPDSDRAKQQGRASPHLRQLLDLGHGSDLAFVVTTRLLNSLARWVQARRPDNRLLETFKLHTNQLWSRVQSYLLKWGWRRLDWGRWGISRDILFAVCMSKDQRDLAMHHLRQSWRKSLLQKWLESDRLDAAIAAQAGLNELIDDSLVDKIRKIYKQLNNSHEKAVFTGGMHTAGSTRWGGTAERHDDQGNMCCPDCETDQYPSLSHVLWHCPCYDRHRAIAKPVCPLTCRLGWSHSTPATMSLRLVAQMGSIREAEVSRRMQRVRLLQDVRGGARTMSHCTNQDHGNIREAEAQNRLTRIRLRQARKFRGGARCFSPCNTKEPIGQGNDARKAWGGNSSLSPCNSKSLTCQTVENRTKRGKTLAPTKVTKDCQGKTRCSPFCCLTKERSQNAWGELQQKIPCSTKVTTCRTKEYGAVGQLLLALCRLWQYWRLLELCNLQKWRLLLCDQVEPVCLMVGTCARKSGCLRICTIQKGNKSRADGLILFCLLETFEKQKGPQKDARKKIKSETVRTSLGPLVQCNDVAKERMCACPTKNHKSLKAKTPCCWFNGCQNRQKKGHKKMPERKRKVKWRLSLCELNRFTPCGPCGPQFKCEFVFKLVFEFVWRVTALPFPVCCCSVNNCYDVLLPTDAFFRYLHQTVVSTTGQVHGPLGRCRFGPAAMASSYTF